MKRTVISILVLIFGISFCMAQNIRDAAEEQRRREAQQRQVADEYNRRATQQPAVIQQATPQPTPTVQPTVTPQTTPQTTAVVEQQHTDLPFSTQTTSAGIVLRGGTLAYKLDWLQRSVESHNTYIVEVGANESIAPRTLEYKGAINVTIILRGVGGNRIVRLSSHGRMFTVNANVTLILDNNITLMGHNDNTGSMVYVDRGVFKMNNGSTITGNIRTDRNSGGGGVYVNNGTFEMTGGTITGNIANSGGGVYMSNNTTFTMTGGTLSGNRSSEGGGVYVRGTFTMRSGSIIGNSAAQNGGGVFILWGGTFAKTGGTITGYNSDQVNGNAVRDGDGTIARSGHAVWYAHWQTPRRKETTAGPNMNLNNGAPDNWDQ